MSASSRDARSARREALRSRIQIASLSKSTPSKVRKSAPTSAKRKGAVQSAMTAATNDAKRIKTTPIVNSDISLEEKSAIITEELPGTVDSDSDASSTTTATRASSTTSTPPSTEALSPSPLSPVPPAMTAVPMSPVSEFSEMSDDDLQRYYTEFEAVSQGEYPDPEPTQPLLLSPELEAIKTVPQDPSPMSPLSLDPYDFDPYSFETMDFLTNNYTLTNPVEDCGIDKYITYHDNLTESGDSEAPQLTPPPPSRRAPFCLYRSRTQPSPVSTSFNPNKRTLLAALETVAADSPHVSREAYLESVILAAASLQQRSMVTGLARQTMAPAPAFGSPLNAS